jgi:outer membrane protein assembly factor BamB
MLLRLATLIVFSTLLLPSVDWPTFRGPNHDGSTEETVEAWSQSPKVAWQTKVGKGTASVAVSGTQAITCGVSQDPMYRVSCLDTQKGQQIWHHDVSTEPYTGSFNLGPFATPCITSESVFVLYPDGILLSLDVQNGNPRWKKHLVNDFGGVRPKWRYATSPVILDGKLILDAGGAEGSTIAINPANGEKIWAVGNAKPAYSTAIPFGNMVLVSKANLMTAHLLTDGTLAWSIDWPTKYGINASSALPFDGKVLISSGYASGRGALFDLSGPEPKKLWQNEALKTRVSTCVVLPVTKTTTGARIFGIAEDETDQKSGWLMCLDATSGATLWQEPIAPMSTLIRAGTNLIVLSESGRLALIPADQNDHKELCAYQLPKGHYYAPPTLAGGQLYCRSDQGLITTLTATPKP